MMSLSKILRLRKQHVQVGKYLFFSSNAEEKIEIPKKIPRSPTDILIALESTVGKDPTAAHYKYHDDPYLLPLSNMGKRTFAMAQEAGRKAAHWVRAQHPDLFQHKECDPPIEPFFPPMVYNENSEVDEQELNKLINTAQVSDAKFVYKLLTQKGIQISNKTLQNLLELFCFQNCEDVLSEEFIEERWFKQSSRAKEKARKTWKDSDFAEELFISIENPTAEAYAALIQGMARYYQAERAWQLFDEAQKKGFTLNTNTFNALISVSNFIKEDYEMRWSLVTNLLSQMHMSKLKPNIGTLNSVLQALTTMGNSRMTKQNTLKVLSEFKKLGIEPSLGSWYYVLLIFCKERGSVSTILNDIMNEIGNKEHKIQDLKDTNFFVTAMEVCRHHLKDVDLAKRVDNLLHYGNNYNLIGDSYKESVYFRHYFALLCANIPLEEFMTEIYQKLVPHIYVPEPGIMAEVLKQVDLNGAVEYVPKLWSDIIIFDQTLRENLVELMLDTMVNNEPLPDSELNEKFAYIAMDIYNRIASQYEYKTNKITFTGELLGKILILLVRNNDFDNSCVIMEKLSKNQQNVVGVPRIEALSLFVDLCITFKAPSRAISCIQYCFDCGFPQASDLALHLHNKLNLDEEFLGRLIKIVGDIFPEKNAEIVN